MKPEFDRLHFAGCLTDESINDDDVLQRMHTCTRYLQFAKSEVSVLLDLLKLLTRRDPVGTSSTEDAKGLKVNVNDMAGDAVLTRQLAKTGTDVAIRSLHLLLSLLFRNDQLASLAKRLTTAHEIAERQRAADLAKFAFIGKLKQEVVGQEVLFRNAMPLLGHLYVPGSDDEPLQDTAVTSLVHDILQQRLAQQRDAHIWTAVLSELQHDDTRLAIFEGPKGLGEGLWKGFRFQLDATGLRLTMHMEERDVQLLLCFDVERILELHLDSMGPSVALLAALHYIFHRRRRLEATLRHGASSQQALTAQPCLVTQYLTFIIANKLV